MQQTVLTLLAMVVAMTMAADVTAPAPAAPGPAPAAPGPADSTATMFIFVCSAVGILFSIFQFYLVSQVGQKELGEDQSNTSAGSLQQQNLLSESDRKAAASRADLKFIYETIREGAQAFLWAEYKICFMFIFAFGLLVLVLVAHPWDTPQWSNGLLTAVSFAVGGLTSIVSGYIGMMVAVYSNARTALEANKGIGDNAPEGWTASFNLAFRAGSVMGFSLCGMSLAILYILCLIYAAIFDTWNTDPETVSQLFECIAGYGLGGSSIAMFGRVGGGIFTKAADVGADLAGKVIGVGEGKKLDEDSPYNPACIADNVGDNVGDVAGMGSDLFGSFGEASCAALLVGASCAEINKTWSYLMFPLYISAVGIIVCMLCSFVATNWFTVKAEKDVETVLKVQLLLTSFFTTAAVYVVCGTFLPADMTIGALQHVTRISCFICVCSGLWGGCLIGFITEYYTSHSYTPVREVAKSTETGAATNIIYGLALGYKSAIAPVTIIAIIIFAAFSLAGMYGVALGALGMLSTLSTCLSIDVFGPVCDNAGGVAEMCEMDKKVRFKTDALDAAGNTTAAIGKGFAIGSAALVSLALFGAFITHTYAGLVAAGVKGVTGEQVNLLEPVVFAFLLFGAMIPYWFSALTMVSFFSFIFVFFFFRSDETTWRPSQCAVRRTLMLTNQETTETITHLLFFFLNNSYPILFFPFSNFYFFCFFYFFFISRLSFV
jgi:H(+)-translocating pyrophosphatase